MADCRTSVTHRMVQCRGFQRVTLAPGAAASVSFPLAPADFAAAVHAGAGAQAAAARWAVAVGNLTAPVATPAGVGSPVAAPGQAMASILQAKSVGL